MIPSSSFRTGIHPLVTFQPILSIFLNKTVLFSGDENVGESYKYLTHDDDHLGDDSIPIDVTHDEKHQKDSTLSVRILFIFFFCLLKECPWEDPKLVF